MLRNKGHKTAEVMQLTRSFAHEDAWHCRFSSWAALKPARNVRDVQIVVSEYICDHIQGASGLITAAHRRVYTLRDTVGQLTFGVFNDRQSFIDSFSKAILDFLTPMSIV